MNTERSSPRYSSIDVWGAEDIAESIVESQFAAVAAVHAVRKQIASAAVAMQARLEDRGRLIYAGAGTSGRLAVQDGAELAPTFGWPERSAGAAHGRRRRSLVAISRRRRGRRRGWD